MECYEIGKEAYDESDYYHAIKWLSEALRLFDNEKPYSSADLINILTYLSKSIRFVS